MAAEVLGHMADCMMLLYTRHGVTHAVRSVFAKLLSEALLDPASLPCLPEQLFARPGLVALARRSAEDLWPALEEKLRPALAPQTAETVAAGLTELLRVLQRQPLADALVVVVLEACGGSQSSLALYRVAGSLCAARLWELVAARNQSDAAFLVELAREPGEAELRWRQILALAAGRDENFLLSLLKLASDGELAALRGAELDRLALARPVSCALAAERLCLTDSALHTTAAEKLDWAAACAAVVRRRPACLSESELATLSAAAVCAGAISALECPVPLALLAPRCVERLRDTVATVVSAAEVLGRLAVVDAEVVRSGWPFGALPWDALAAASPGLASFESDEWFVACGGDAGRGGKEKSPPVDEKLMLQAAVLLELLAGPFATAVEEEHAAFAFQVAAAAGLGRSHRSCDDAGFDPTLNAQLKASFTRAAAASQRIREQFSGLLQRLGLEARCVFLARVVCSQGIFVGATAPPVGAKEEGVRLACITGALSPAEACQVLVNACDRPQETWADVDVSRAAAARILASGDALVLTPELRSGLARLLSHRSWQAQQGASHALSRCGVAALEETESAAAAGEQGGDAWACVVAWWTLLSLLAVASSEQRGQAAARLGQGPFAHFAETVFAFVDVDEESDHDIDSAATLAGLHPHLARDRSRLAGRAWLLAVRHLRTLARDWYGQLQDKHLLAVAKAFSSERVCAAISTAELAAAAAAEPVEGLALKVSGRSVVATVEKDDVAVELTVTLPRLFPLQAAEVQATRGNLPEALVRRWVLSLTILLVSSECSLAHALQQWSRSAARYFDGIESCHICFCSYFDL
jgi:hypothetical protein